MSRFSDKMHGTRKKKFTREGTFYQLGAKQDSGCWTSPVLLCLTVASCTKKLFFLVHPMTWTLDSKELAVFVPASLLTGLTQWPDEWKRH
ncbi:hypothetical protein MUK42_22957 [Musa troglodytarum]|uniref:Uncharacterized protein n=1 Tax=Musa troglodytarum TaxID=320322 RepID=A0A9E7GHI9_9LILI|nr:hypothetical protein MUK42_22957 [Musa troglodytarum]